MGLSVSAATGIIILAMIVGISFLCVSLADSFQKLRVAGEDRLSYLIDREKTCITIRDVNHTSPLLKIYVLNCGSRTITISQMVVLVDGIVVKNGMTMDVEGKNTDLLMHGETLTITITDVISKPSSIKVVTGNGVEAYW